MPIAVEVKLTQRPKDQMSSGKKRKRDLIGKPHEVDDREEKIHLKKAKKEKKQKKTPVVDEDEIDKDIVEMKERAENNENAADKEAKNKKKKKKKIKKDKKMEEDETNTIGTKHHLVEDDDNDPFTKHPTILKKFHKLLKKKQEQDAESVAVTLNDVAAPVEHSSPTHKINNVQSQIQNQGLQPLPQPVSTKSSTKLYLPLSSSLPTYHSNAITFSPSISIPFSALPLSTKLQTRLSQHLKYISAFAVQAAVIPLLLEPYHQRNDLLVSAPTGSGKTLSYMLPIIHDLSSRVVTRLRALIIVPTRELVSQVRDTAELLASGLKIGIAWGARGLDAERKLLLEESEEEEEEDGEEKRIVHGGKKRWKSKVDILISTPGRLVEHITSTKGFSLKGLKWLVVDEADRLLAQSFQEWVGTVMKSLESGDDGDSGNIRAFSGSSKTIDLRGLGLGLGPGNSSSSLFSSGNFVTKVVLSATMTKDAGKVSALNLRKPKLVVIENKLPGTLDMGDTNSNGYSNTSSANGPTFPLADGDQANNYDNDDNDQPDEIFSVPHTLSEYYISVSSPSDKPLLLESLLRLHNLQTGTLVFTKTNETAARLHRLLQLMAQLDNNKPLRVGLISGEIPKAERKRTLSLFKRNAIDILVASDLISRGLDVPDVIRHVINYDVPGSSRGYVHRVGRTARAGKEGDAWSLVSDNEARWFWRNIGKGIRRGEEKGVKRVILDVDETQRERYENALERLGGEVRGVGEEIGEG